MSSGKSTIDGKETVSGLHFLPDEAFVSPRSLATLRACLAAIGSADFYPTLAALPNDFLACERHLVMRYARYAKPEFLVNASLTTDAVDFYLRGLYRLDPLLRLVEAEDHRRVATFRQIHLEDTENEFYDEIFRSGLIYDELAIMVPIFGGGVVALCFDRDGSEFSSREVAVAAAWQPVLTELHDLHVKTGLMTGLTTLFGRGFVGVLAVDQNDRVFYRNDAWSGISADLDEVSLIKRAFEYPPKRPVTFGDGIVHWDFLESERDNRSPYRVVMFEARSADAATLDVSDRLTKFCTEYDLSPREREIVMEMTRGAHNAAISRRLGLSVGTVKNYKRRLYDKLDITNEREIFPRIISYLFGEEPAI